MTTAVGSRVDVKAVLAERLPCTGCEHVYACGLDLKACRDFRDYVTSGSVISGRKRTPTRTWYLKIFWEGEG